MHAVCNSSSIINQCDLIKNIIIIMLYLNRYIKKKKIKDIDYIF